MKLPDIDLTEEGMADAEAVAVGHGALVEADAIDLAWDTVKAALPHIAAQVREQVAREIEEHGALYDRDADWRDGVDEAAHIARNGADASGGEG